MRGFRRAIAGAPPGRQLYCAPGGSDATGTGTFANPWKTLHHVTAQMVAGDTAYFRGGTYLGQTWPDWNAPNATAAKPITVRNYPNEVPVFDGELTTSGFLTIRSDYLPGGDWVVIQGLTIKNYKGNYAIWAGYSGSGPSRVTGLRVRGCEFRNIGTNTGLHHAIYLSYGLVDVEVSGCKFFDSSGSPIHGFHNPGINGARIFNNLSVNSNYGIIAASGCHDVQIFNNTVVGVGPDGNGIEITGPRGEVAEGDGDNNNYDSIVRNNLLVDCVNGGLASAGAINPTIAYNHFHNPATTDGTNATTGDPLFVNTAAEDYRLQSGSPAVDNATPTGAPTADITGTQRPVGAGIDRGCYER